MPNYTIHGAKHPNDIVAHEGIAILIIHNESNNIINILLK